LMIFEDPLSTGNMTTAHPKEQNILNIWQIEHYTCLTTLTPHNITVTGMPLTRTAIGVETRIHSLPLRPAVTPMVPTISSGKSPPLPMAKDTNMTLLSVVPMVYASARETSPIVPKQAA
jgi:hypothetical protein